MNISDFTERLIDADEFNYVRHDTYWCGNVKKDPLTGKYYVWEAKWCAADREGWRPIGSDYESARHKIPLIRLARLPQKRKRVPFSIASRP